MTIDEIISTVDMVLPNQYTSDQKREWINELERRIHEDLIIIFNPEDTFIPAATVSGEVLGNEKEMYVSWVAYKICFYNNDTLEANNYMSIFNSQYNAFERHYIRTHEAALKRFEI